MSIPATLTNPSSFSTLVTPLNEAQLIEAQLSHIDGESRVVVGGLRAEQQALRRRLIALDAADLPQPLRGSTMRSLRASSDGSSETTSEGQVRTPQQLRSLSDALRRYAPLGMASLPRSIESIEVSHTAEQRLATRRARIDSALEELREHVATQERLTVERHASRGSGGSVARRIARAQVTAAGMEGPQHSLRAEIAANVADAAGGAPRAETMLAVLSDLATAHHELLRRYHELHQAMERAAPKLSGLPREEVEHMLPRLSYAAVLRGSRGYAELPGGIECAICQSEMSVCDSVRLLPCRHCFHADCIDPWLERSVCCPTCRGAVC